MKRVLLAYACVAVVLSGCDKQANEEEQTAEALRSVNVIDEFNLNELMLNAGSPDEAILYFRKSSAENPAGSTLSAVWRVHWSGAEER